MKNFVAPGQTIQHTPAAARAAGAATLIGTRIGVALADVVISTEGAFATAPVVNVTSLPRCVPTEFVIAARA